jgi:ATP/maltotriose-dependent transcriptional regulator MalT
MNFSRKVQIFSPSLSRREQASLKGKRILGRVIRMAEREKEIIALIVDKMSNKQIAGRLNISVFTIKSHIHNVLENWRDRVVFRL